MPPTFEPLHGQANWLTWKLQAYLYFEMNGLKKIIDGMETIPDEPVAPAMAVAQAVHDQHEAAIQRRERALEKAALVKYVLSRTVDAEHHHIYVSKATPREQWVALEAVFERETPMSRVLIIKQLVHAKLTPGMTVSEYFALFKDLETKAGHMNLNLGDVVLWFMLIGIEEYPNEDVRVLFQILSQKADLTREGLENALKDVEQRELRRGRSWRNLPSLLGQGRGGGQPFPWRDPDEQPPKESATSQSRAWRQRRTRARRIYRTTRTARRRQPARSVQR